MIRNNVRECLRIYKIYGQSAAEPLLNEEGSTTMQGSSCLGFKRIRNRGLLRDKDEDIV